MAEDIGEAIRHWRESLGWSQVKIARKLGISSQRFSNWENGRGTPSLQFIQALHQLGFRGGPQPLHVEETRSTYPSPTSLGTIRILVDLLYDCDQDPDMRASARRELYRLFELTDT